MELLKRHCEITDRKVPCKIWNWRMFLEWSPGHTRLLSSLEPSFTISHLLVSPLRSPFLRFHMTIWLWPMTWSTTCYPQIWCFVMWNSSSCRNLRTHTSRQDSLTYSFSPDAGALSVPRGKEHPYHQKRGREGCWEESEWTGLAKFPLVYHP